MARARATVAGGARRLQAEGRRSGVRHPSERQRCFDFPAPRGLPSWAAERRPGRCRAGAADVGAGSLTTGKLNAVRAAFKADVKSAAIARQFGISQTDVKKALAGESQKPSR